MKPRVATLDLLEHLATSHVCSTSCWSVPTFDNEVSAAHPS
jgi:hypothetical protein